VNPAGHPQQLLDPGGEALPAGRVRLADQLRPLSPGRIHLPPAFREPAALREAIAVAEFVTHGN